MLLDLSPFTHTHMLRHVYNCVTQNHKPSSLLSLRSRTVRHNQRMTHSTAQHSTAQHSTAQHSTAQHSTAQHSSNINQAAGDKSLQTGKKTFTQTVSTPKKCSCACIKLCTDLGNRVRLEIKRGQDQFVETSLIKGSLPVFVVAVLSCQCPHSSYSNISAVTFTLTSSISD